MLVSIKSTPYVQKRQEWWWLYSDMTFQIHCLSRTFKIIVLDKQFLLTYDKYAGLTCTGLFSTHDQKCDPQIISVLNPAKGLCFM